MSGLLLCIMMAPLALILYVVLRCHAKPRKDVLLGVTLYFDERRDEAVSETVKAYKRILALILALSLLLCLPPLFFEYFSYMLTWYMTWLVITIVAFFAALARANASLLKVKSELRANGAQAQDGDEHWRLGFLYFNKDDKHLIVDNRNGTGQTMNMAHLAGKLVMGFAGLVLVAMPFFGVWLTNEEFTAPALTYEGTALKAEHTGVFCELETDAIVSVELLEELPPRKKLVGNSMPGHLKGDFDVEGYGECKLLLNPKSPPFMVVKTAKSTYVLADASPSVTRDVFSRLSADLSQ